ncbi:MAG: c-type cytochrome biogenesis protein CcsB [Marmoricola sp.]
MSHDQFELLSNQAIAVCGAFYFVALLCHLAEWAVARSVPAAVPAAASVGAGAPIEAELATADESDEAAVKMERFARWGMVATIVAAAVHFVAVASRGLAADPVRVPWGNMYEFTMTGTLVVVVGYLLMYKKFSLQWLSPVVTGFVLITLMVDVLLLYTPVVPLRDALQSPWLVIHVIAAITATGAFTLGGMASVLYLVKERWLERGGSQDASTGGYLARLPGLNELDRMAYRTHAFAFPVWTFAALIAGPIWAQAAWGRYWGWDPKEVWAFITWVVYAAYLHARATAGWKGRAAAIIALIGLATLWFNFVGINFFFGSGSQHSYA